MKITVEYVKKNNRHKKELNIINSNFKIKDLKQKLSLNNKYNYITLVNGTNKKDDYDIKNNDYIKIYYLMDGG